MKNWLVHFVNTQSGWLVSQVHVIAEDAETAVKTAAEKFGIDLEREDAVTAHAQDWTDVAGPVEPAETVQAEPAEPAEPVSHLDLSGDPLHPSRFDVPPPPGKPVSTLPEIIEHDADMLADDAEREIAANPAAAEVAKTLRELTPEALELLKDMIK
jgi:hypothetical protein